MERPTEFSGALTRSTLVKQVIQRFPTSAIVVPQDAPVTALSAAIAENRDCHTIAVADPAGALVGVIPVDVVIQSLLVHVMPEEFLADVLEPEKAAELAKEQHARVAGDLMHEPLSVSAEATVQEAIHKLHHARLEGLPVVDENQRVVGYIGLFQVVLFGLQH